MGERDWTAVLKVPSRAESVCCKLLMAGCCCCCCSIMGSGGGGGGGGRGLGSGGR